LNCYSERSYSLTEYWIDFGARFDDLHAAGYNSTKSEPIWMKFGRFWAKCWGLAMADFGCDPHSSDSLRGSRFFFGHMNNAWFHRFPSDNFYEFCKQQRRSVSRCKVSKQNFENFIIRGRFSKKKHKNYSKNFPILATSGRQNFAMITDSRKLTAKINLYGMSSFHFYCWNQFTVIPMACTLHTRTYTQKFRCGLSDADHSIMRYICNHREAPWTIYIQQMRAFILFTITDCSCAKK